MKRNISENYKYEKKLNKLIFLATISSVFCFGSLIGLVILGIVCKLNYWLISVAGAIGLTCCCAAEDNIFDLIDKHKKMHLEKVKDNYNCFELSKEEINCLESTQETLNKPMVVKKQQENLDEEIYKF